MGCRRPNECVVREGKEIAVIRRQNRMRQCRWFVRSLLMMILLPCVASSIGEAATIYVNANAALDGAGRSWDRALRDLQKALAISRPGDGIWVAAGTYYPAEANDQNASFVLKTGVRLFGGFIGGEQRLDQRDWERNRTVLSGDIGVRGERSDNVRHVVLGADEAVLDGFTIQDGYAMGGGPGGGPGQSLREEG